MNVMNLKRSEPESRVMTITPEIAKKLLETSPGNRSLRSGYIDALAGAMRRGEWRVTSQGIGIDVNGHLRDAHHRLHACIKANVPFQSLVVLGMPVNAYEVTDTGIVRSLADRIGVDQRIAEVYRFAGELMYRGAPTADQVHTLADAGLGDVAKTLYDHCRTTKKYYSSAAMKLAACITMMNGGDADYVLQQYRALCLFDIDAMSCSAKALARQVNNGTTNATGRQKETLARGLRVFDVDRKDVSRIQVSDADISAACDLVRNVLKEYMLKASEKANDAPIVSGNYARAYRVKSTEQAVAA